MPELSVIVPTLKPRDEIESVTRLESGSFDDDDYEVLVQREDSATKARNAGIRRASAEKLVFLDDDSLPTDGYLERVSDLLDCESVVTGRIVHPRDDVIKRFTTHYDQGPEPRYVTRFWGCNAACRREVFEEVGMWDENITWGHEEKELADRMLTRHPIYYDPELTVVHPYADSVRDYWRKQYKLELQTPYLWEKEGVPRSQQYFRTLQIVANPMNYVGFSPKHAVVRAGSNLMQFAGRVVGMRRR
ncbi:MULTISPECIES: glycosyltransferase family 2 protein [Haloferacaceae]|uniref:Glycosyltransferase family 2 protein n=1 Tax=Halorubrum glutamatedens TaxID=2707018 RepID=A0ABD5QSC5_9EURY|nr:glycosyltransferase [Halobellus captivus]